jgi:hypothetical protein
MRCGRTGGVTVGNHEVAEAGLLEDVVDRTGTEAGASLEAVEDAAAASEANKPLHEKFLYIFLKGKLCKKPRPLCCK